MVAALTVLLLAAAHSTCVSTIDAAMGQLRISEASA